MNKIEITDLTNIEHWLIKTIRIHLQEQLNASGKENKIKKIIVMYDLLVEYKYILYDGRGKKWTELLNMIHKKIFEFVNDGFDINLAIKYNNLICNNCCQEKHKNKICNNKCNYINDEYQVEKYCVLHLNYHQKRLNLLLKVLPKSIVNHVLKEYIMKV